MRVPFLILLVALSVQFSSLEAQEIWLPNLHALSGKYANKILKETDLPKVLNDIPNDKMLEIERLASYLFHQLLNQYRISNNLKPLAWDDRLWLAARNHNIYMANCEFGHKENNATSPYFTGQNHAKRIDFVTNTHNSYCTSENVQYYYIWLRFYVVSAPEQSIQSWKDSPGHNENMLDSYHISEGTSIYIDIKTSKVYGTSIFADDMPVTGKSISISWSTVLAAIYKNYTGEKNDKYYNNELKVGSD